MGIKNLAKLLEAEAPDSIRMIDSKSLHGRKIAIDASMAIYQFLIAVRSGNHNQAAVQLTNADGETTSHIQGLFNRTIRFLSEGMKPVYVFDGKPPTFKSGELLKRREKREKAAAALKVATEEGDVEEQDKQSKRLVRAGTKENDDCKRLLELMGVPIILAPCEAEAQAASMAKAGLVYATGTEDMDALTFQTPVLLRKMTFSNAKAPQLQSINYEKALEGLGLTHDEFVDMCILLGCDYCDTIKGVGMKTALKLIKEHKTIENILEAVKGNTKFVVPPGWLPPEKKDGGDDADHESREDGEDDAENEEKKEQDAAVDDFVPDYVNARKLFKDHEVETNVSLKWKPCQAEELKKFLVDEMCFNPDRVDSSIKRLQESYKKHAKPQTRLDSFFKVKKPAPGSGNKRKAAPTAKDKKGAKKKPAFKRR